MKWLIYFVWLALTAAFKVPEKDYEHRNYFIVELNTSISSRPLWDFIDQHQENYKYEHQVRGLDDHFVFSIDKNHVHNQFLGNYKSNDDNLIQKRQEYLQEYQGLINNQHLKSIHMLAPKKLEKRMPVQIEASERDFVPVDSSQQGIKDAMDKLDIHDPIFQDQWHIINSANPGQDVNVTGLWYEGITGKGVVSCIIDDGVDYESEDLKDNFNAKGSWDFNDNTELPKPRLFNDYHGTRCAGEIAAAKNDVCGVGVAYDGQVSGVRILSGIISAEDEAAAMIYGLDVNDIYSCSWGPTDDGKTLSAPEMIVKKAMIKGIQQGRDNKGAIYVFASGNGGRSEDSCNFDGYTNSIYSITVGAIDYRGYHPTYAEACSAVMVVTYSSGSGEHIHTTDIHGKCASQHGGTSAAAPLAAGIFSLVLQSNPSLTWRDLQYVAALSSVPVNENDGHYQLTALNRRYSHKYGYGKIDAYKMAKFAKNWENVNPQSWYYSDVVIVNESIEISDANSPEKAKVISSTIKVTPQDLKVMNLARAEHVTVTVNIKSTFRGEVGVRLTSPFGVVSDLATFRRRDKSSKGFVNWTFLSVAHWGEHGIGDWKIEVFNEKSTNGNTIEFTDWQLRIFGECSDAEKAEQYDVDKDYAQIRRDKIQQSKETSTVVTPVTSSLKTLSESSTVASLTEETGTPSKETGYPDEDKQPVLQTLEAQTLEVPEDGEKKVKKDHTVLYLISLVIVGFIVIAVIMTFHQTPGSSRRRRRDEYEFDIIPGEDFSDSEFESHDSLDLGLTNRNTRDQETDRLYDELNAESLPDYEQDEEMFKIGEDDESKSNENDPDNDQRTGNSGDTGENKKKVNFKD